MTARPASPVVALRPHPLLWLTAVQLAGGDVRRIVLVSETEAVVVNGRAGCST